MKNFKGNAKAALFSRIAATGLALGVTLAGATLAGAAPAVPAAPETHTSAIRVHISSILDQIDTFGYLGGIIAAASGHDWVEQVCLEKPEVQYLLAHPAEAVPVMLERLDSPTGIHCYFTRIVYFVVFRHAQDTRVLPALARYLDAVPDGENVGAPGSPFHYAVVAIRTLAPSTLPADAPGTSPASPDLRVVFRARHQIAAKVRSWTTAPKQNKAI